MGQPSFIEALRAVPFAATHSTHEDDEGRDHGRCESCEEMITLAPWRGDDKDKDGAIVAYDWPLIYERYLRASGHRPDCAIRRIAEVVLAYDALLLAEREGS